MCMERPCKSTILSFPISRNSTNSKHFISALLFKAQKLVQSLFCTCISSRYSGPLNDRIPVFPKRGNREVEGCQSGPLRKHRIREVIKRAEVKYDIELSGRLNVSALAIWNSAITPAIFDKKREISMCRSTTSMPVQQAPYLTTAWIEL